MDGPVYGFLHEIYQCRYQEIKAKRHFHSVNDGRRSYIFKMVPGGFIPEEDMGYFYANAQLPNAASMQRSDVIARELEEIMMNTPEVEYITTATGYSMLSGSMLLIMYSCLVPLLIGAKENIQQKK